MFDYVDLEDSWVLNWKFDAESQQLVFDLEASLWKGHQYYTNPLPEEYTCYKPAKLVFDKVTSIDGLLPMDKAKSTFDPDGTTDYGNIEGFREVGNGIYKFGGDIAEDFGEVTVACEDVRLEFTF